MKALTWADILAAYAMYVMMTYLTNVWKISTTHAAGIINIWNGITPALAVVFGCLVDAFMGDFYMLVLSSISYSIGLGLLAMSTPPVFGPCSDYKEECIGHSQKVLFYISLPLIAVGMAGHLVSLKPFLNLQIQTEKEDKAEDDAKTHWQILGSIMVVIVGIVGGIGLSYIKPWSVRFGIPAICSVVATLMFFTGFRVYERAKPEGSPLTTTLRVFVVAARNISQPIPNPNSLYNNKDVRSTSTLRCFDKAAIKLPEKQEPKRWNVCSVGEVEETKIGVRMLPMWLTFIMIGIVLSINNTYFLEQANHMDRKLGKIKVSIPIFLLFYNYTMETRRLHRIRDHALLDKPDEMIPMSIFALLPQFMLLAAVDGIANNSIKTFFKHQTLASVSKYLTFFSKGVLGLGTAASVLSVYVVGKVSERNQKPNWFQYTLNRSRLDRYYWVLAVLSAANLVIYIIVATFYTYKDITENDEDEEVEAGGITQDDLFLFAYGNLGSRLTVLLLWGVVDRILKWCRAEEFNWLNRFCLLCIYIGLLSLFSPRADLAYSTGPPLILPTRIIQDLEQLMRGFLWFHGEMKKGKAKVAWENICFLKSEGGLGIRRSFWDVPPKAGMSWGWRKLLQIRTIIREHIWYRIGNGNKVFVWFDKWCEECPLRSLKTVRQITSAGFDMNDKVVDVIEGGSWKWQPNWIQIHVPPLMPNLEDKLL
ncbi:NRT1/ PTR family 5.5-like protein [Tanacetum coccineum]